MWKEQIQTFLTVHDGDEPVSGRLRANPDTGELPFQQVLDEAGLTD